LARCHCRKKEGRLKGYKKDIMVVDLPGVYSLSPYTMEEVIARDYLLQEKPEVIINIVDASNLERNLYLTTQLQELGIPMVVALNMMDIVEKRGDVIDSEALSKRLGCPVAPISAARAKGWMSWSTRLFP
jgi:ferrous iron transport protein B